MSNIGDESARNDQLRTLEEKEAEALTEMLAAKYHIPYINLRIAPVDLDALKILSEQEARAAGVAILSAVGKKLSLAVKNPTIETTTRTLDRLREKGYTTESFLASLPGLERVWKKYKEIKIKFDYQAWLWGFVIIAICISLEFLNQGNGSGFNPTVFTGGMFYLIILVKIVGMVLVAAVIEEIFMRSFLIRMFIDVNFEKVKIGKFTWLSFILTTAFFGLMHGASITGSRLIVGLISGVMFNLWLYHKKDIFSCI